MKKAFNRKESLRLLREGLIKPNPSDPSKPMWTVEDFDQEPESQLHIKKTWLNHPTIPNPQWNKPEYINPLEEFRDMTIKEIKTKLLNPLEPSDSNEGF